MGQRPRCVVISRPPMFECDVLFLVIVSENTMEEWICALAETTNVHARDFFAEKMGNKAKCNVQLEHALKVARDRMTIACNKYMQSKQMPFRKLCRRQKGRSVPTLEFLMTIGEMGQTLQKHLRTITDAYTAFVALTTTMHDENTTELVDLPSNLGQYHIRYRKCAKKRVLWRKAANTKIRSTDCQWMYHLNAISSRIYKCDVCETVYTDPDTNGMAENLSMLYECEDTYDLCCSTESEEEMETEKGQFPVSWAPPSTEEASNDAHIRPTQIVEVEEAEEERQDSQLMELEEHPILNRLSNCQLCDRKPTAIADYAHLRQITHPAAVHYGIPPYFSTDQLSPFICHVCAEELQCTSCLSSGEAVIQVCSHDTDLIYCGLHMSSTPEIEIGWSLLTRRYPYTALPHIDGWERSNGYRTVRKHRPEGESLGTRKRSRAR